MCLTDWERVFTRKDACDIENASKNCFLVTPPCIEVYVEFLQENVWQRGSYVLDIFRVKRKFVD